MALVTLVNASKLNALDGSVDKDKVERYKQRVKQQVSFIGGTFRASGAGAVSSSDEYSKEDSTVTMAPPLTPNSTANILGVGTSNDPFSSTIHPTSTPSASDAFEYQPVFISDLGGNTTSTNGHTSYSFGTVGHSQFPPAASAAPAPFSPASSATAIPSGSSDGGGGSSECETSLHDDARGRRDRKGTGHVLFQSGTQDTIPVCRRVV
ncbi:hypothetical protein FRC17_004306 [Serendipita sp. 399]|nr:hypothetical protein FRC17_004306 [Serendipita sp. 399]